MKTIYKYPITDTKREGFSKIMPRGAEILSFQVQNRTPCIWALVDTEEPIEIREFYLEETGQRIARDTNRLTFIGTVQLESGNYVLHLFEVTEQ